MCGITGYVGPRAALPILVESLRNLEYRGYDSAGIALLNDRIDVYKRSGEVDDLERELPTDDPAAGTGLGHTRWSTHGKPTDENAHPHTDCSGTVAVVHNGIIDNYDDLREELRERHEFTSETDTEVVPHLVEDGLSDGGSLLDVVDGVIDRLEGSFALGVLASGHEGIVAARQDSPLVVGLGDGEMFLGSDAPAFIEHTREVIYLEDGDVARLSQEGVEIRNKGDSVDRAVHTIEWDAEAAEKGGYEHYMLKEIHEQPAAIRQALSGRVDELAAEVDLDIGLPDEYLRSLEEIRIVACGTSYHAGLYARHLLEDYADVRTSAEIASEFEAGGGRDPWRTLVIAVTQSGETADTLGAVRRAKASGARTLAVTNTVGSTVTRETDETVFIRAGPEIGVAASKTFVSQVATLAMLAIQIGRVRDALASETAASLIADLRGLPGAVQQVLDDEERIAEVAETYADHRAFFYIGRHLGHPVALEGALKLKEISYAHAEGFPAGELKHGPLALVTPDTAVVAVLTEGARPAETLNNVKEVDSRGAPVIGLTSNPEMAKFLETTFEVPDLGPLEPVVANVHLQLLAYYVARCHDRPIDKPRNLAKSVTVE